MEVKDVQNKYYEKPTFSTEAVNDIAGDNRWDFLEEKEFTQEMMDSLAKNPKFVGEDRSILLLMHEVLYNIMDSLRDSHFGCRNIHDENRSRIKEGYEKLGNQLKTDSFYYFISIAAGIVGLVGAGFAPTQNQVNPGKILETISGVGKTGGEFANAFTRGGQEILRGKLQEFQNDLKSDETTDGKIMSDLQRLYNLAKDADERQYQSMRKPLGGG